MARDGNIPSKYVFRIAQIKKVYGQLPVVIGPEAIINRHADSNRSPVR